MSLRVSSILPARRRHPPANIITIVVAVAACVVGFLIGLLFTQRCGNYFVMMFDDYSATLPLIIVVVFETFSVSWLYGADR